MLRLSFLWGLKATERRDGESWIERSDPLQRIDMEPRTCPHPTCGHEWTPRKANPKKCPQCQNPLWRSPRPKRSQTIPVLGAEPLELPEEKANPMEEGRTGSANVPTGVNPECVRAPIERFQVDTGVQFEPKPWPWVQVEEVAAPIEKDSLSDMKAKAEQLMRQLAQ